MVNARQKGRTGELQVLNMLTRHTGLPFTQVPGSGSGKVKGDLYLEHHKNVFLIEVKFYKDNPFGSKIFTQKSNNLVQWWNKLIRQAEDNSLEPLLFWKKNHEQFFVATTRKPLFYKKYVHISWLGAYIMTAEQWLEKETMEFTNGNRIYEPWKADPEWELINR